MKLTYVFGVAAAAAVALAAPRAQAQLMTGQGNWYVGVEGGWTSLPNTNFTGGGTAGYASYDDGYNVGARLGYMMGPWRFEGEFSYRNNSLNGVSVTSPFALKLNPVSGNRQTYAEMFNVLYDFNMGLPVTPHIGGGIGIAEQTASENLPAPAANISDTDTNFAYQAIAGFRWMATPNLAVDVDYRYFATTDPTFTASNGVAAKTSYGTHNVLASVSWLFNPPPPPPPAPMAMPAPPPPAAPRVFIVFFDWDKDAITAEGEQIIHQAADAYRSGAPIQLQVTGYTDRSGSPGYNQRLSERRANNVARALAALGVPKNQMVVSGRGENDNRVPTAPGVREPQNRRVEIVAP
jgi:outer membrane protein OmpA-like peptidoglycan-associated protein